jgi:hypothetical protein
MELMLWLYWSCINVKENQEKKLKLKKYKLQLPEGPIHSITGWEPPSSASCHAYPFSTLDLCSPQCLWWAKHPSVGLKLATFDIPKKVSHIVRLRPPSRSVKADLWGGAWGSSRHPGVSHIQPRLAWQAPLTPGARCQFWVHKLKECWTEGYQHSEEFDVCHKDNWQWP